MNISNTTLRTALRKVGYLTLACGLPLTLALRAQNSSSSYNYQSNNYQSNDRRTPRYTGHSWTDHLVLEGGAGVSVPAGNTQNYANTGYNVLLGGGLKFNDRLSVLAEWNFNRLGVPRTLAGVIAGTPGGNEHLWTVDVNPKFNFIHSQRADGYVIGGGGFSRALVNYTVPVEVGCGYYYYYYYGGGCVGNVTVAHTSSNQGNLDIGLGGEWRPSPYEREMLFLEARYEKLFTPKGLPPGPNATYIPVTIGVRW